MFADGTGVGRTASCVAKLNKAGCKVVEITAAALNDQTTVDANLDEIAVYLDREDLFAE